MSRLCFLSSVPLLHSPTTSFISVNQKRPSASVSRSSSPARIVTKCSTELPDDFVWVDAVEISGIDAGSLSRRVLCGLDICVACSMDGQVYAVGNKGAPLGVPLSEGSVVAIDGASYIKCPQYGSLFDMKTGEVKDKASWVVSPPIISNAIRFLFPDPIGVPIYPVREENGVIQVCVNMNARGQYEQKYWKGILDASGKADGGYF